jgi:hypothetical protein
MTTQSIDTNPKAEEIQISIMKNANIAGRLALAVSLSSTTIGLSKRAIERANPEANPNELTALFVKYNYGNALAEKLSRYFREKV